MPNKRIYDLDEIFTLSTGYKIPVDKDGNVETECIDINQMAAYIFAKYFQFNTVTVVKGVNTINVADQTSSAYKIMGNLMDSEGGISYYTYDQTATNFKLYASAAGTFTYLIKNA